MPASAPWVLGSKACAHHCPANFSWLSLPLPLPLPPPLFFPPAFPPLVCFIFLGTLSQYSPGYTGTHFVGQADFHLTEIYPGSLGLKMSVCPTTWLKCLGICSVDQVGLEFTEICLPLPPEHWDERHVPPLPSFQNNIFKKRGRKKWKFYEKGKWMWAFSCLLLPSLCSTLAHCLVLKWCLGGWVGKESSCFFVCRQELFSFHRAWLATLWCVPA